MDFLPISFPTSALYVSLETLFDLNEDSRAGGPCQTAIREVLAGLPELGIVPLPTTPYVLSFPSTDVYDTFVDLLVETPCHLWSTVPEPSFGKREMLTTSTQATGAYTASNGVQAQVTLRLEPDDGSGHVQFQNGVTFGMTTQELLRIIYQRVGMIASQGALGYPLVNARIVLTEIALQNETRPVEPPPQPVAPQPPQPAPKSGNPLFRMFDWIFDTIDKNFAGGTGTEFTTMPSGKTGGAAQREAVWMATGEALHDALRGTTSLVEPVSRVEVRFPVAYRDAVAPDFESRGGTIEDEVHDGTTWTITGSIKASNLADYEERLQAITEPSAQVNTLQDVRYDPAE